MKKIISIILVLLLSFTAFPISVNAAIRSGDWEYDVVYTENDEQFVSISRYINDSSYETVVIPSMLDGNKVVGISSSSNVFGKNTIKNIIVSEGIVYINRIAEGRKNLSIILPSSLKYIGENAFKNCSINSISMSEGLEGIDKNAFNNCVFNCTVDLPDSLKYLGYSSFESSNLSTVKIGKNARVSAMEYAYPSSVSGNDYEEEYERFKKPPFFNTVGLENIIVDEDAEYLCSEGNVLYSKNKDVIYFVGEGHSDFEMPDTVTSLFNNCFLEKDFERIKIASSLKTIKSGAFAYGTKINNLDYDKNCSLLEIEEGAFASVEFGDFVLPNTVVFIGEKAFSGCKFESFSIQDGSLLQTISEYAFEKTNIKTADFSVCPVLTSIGCWCFSSCTELESINLEDTLFSYLECNTFDGCTSLKTVLLPKYFYFLESNSFNNCTSLETVHTDNYFVDTDLTFSYVFNNSNPEALQTGYSEYLGTITEGDFTFFEYDSFVVLSKYNGSEADYLVTPSYVNGKPVTRINKFAYNNKKSIKKLVLPSKLEYLGKYVLSDNIESIEEFPESLLFIEDQSGIGNQFNNGISFNEGLIYIGYRCMGSAQFDTIILPDSLLVLREDNLHDGIKSITFGAGIRNIDESLGKAKIFIRDNYCIVAEITNRYKIEEINVSENNPFFSSQDGVLYNKDKTELICYPANKADEEFVIPSTVKRIREAAFGNVNRLKKLTIPKSVSRIDNYAFYNSEINQIIFSDNGELDSLNNDAFKGSFIESVHIGSGIKVITSAFKDLPLKSITFSEGIETIGRYAFSNTEIESVYLPSTVSNILDSAFENCSKLSDVYLNNVRYLKSLAFANCISLESIDLTGVRFDSRENCGTFYGCVNLKKFYFTKEEREAYIEEHEFSGNETVESVVIGSSIEEIREAAFENCSNLETAYISPEVKTIAHNAFKGCPKLTIISTLNSPAINYAKANNINYKEQSFIIAPIPDQTYTGRALKPSLIVCQDGFILTADKHYKATYRNNIKVGTATVAVTGLGDYSIFAATARFNIVAPANGEESSTSGGSVSGGNNTANSGTSSDSQKKTTASSSTSGRYSFVTEVARTTIKALKKKRKGFVVKWKRIKKADGYQIQYSKKKGFKKSRLVTVKGRLRSRKTVKKLERKQRYYVRVRAYRNVNGSKVYSAWSFARKVKTK